MTYIRIFYNYDERNLQEQINDFLDKFEDESDIIKVSVSIAATRDQTQDRDYHHFVGTILYKGDIVEE